MICTGPRAGEKRPLEVRLTEDVRERRTADHGRHERDDENEKHALDQRLEWQRDEFTGEGGEVHRQEDELENEVVGYQRRGQRDVAVRDIGEDEIPVDTGSDEEHEQADPERRVILEEDEAEADGEDRVPDEVDREGRPDDATVSNGRAKSCERSLGKRTEERHQQKGENQLFGDGRHTGKPTDCDLADDGEGDDTVWYRSTTFTTVS